MKTYFLPIMLLASLSGPLKAQSSLSKYDQNVCDIKNQNVVFKLGGSDIRISKSFEADPLLIQRLADEALKALGSVTYRWSMDQTDYKIDGKDFLTFGFKNLHNKSKEAKELAQILDQACDMENDLTLFGEFNLILKIGEQTLADILEIHKDGNQALGSYQVPGGFKSELYNLHSFNENLNFEILVEERGESYRLDFKLHFKNKDEIEGKVLHKDGNLFASVLGRRAHVTH